MHRFRGFARSAAVFRKQRPRLALSLAAKKIPRTFRVSTLSLGALTLLLTSYSFSNNVIDLDSPATPTREISAEEVTKHNNIEDGVWVVVDGEVYDLTEFLNVHPGGQAIILKYAGKDATLLFNKIHPKNTIEKHLPPGAHLGQLVGTLDVGDDPFALEEERCERMRELRPPLTSMFNIIDFEYVAKQVIPGHAWAYYSGGADDEVTLRDNHNAYNRIFFKPKVLIDVDEVDMTTEFLGVKTSAPFYCSAAAAAKLGHPDGELSIARGCGKEDIIQMISANASYPLDEIVDHALPEQTQWYQMYVQPDRKVSLDMIDHVEERGLGAIFVTVDSPQFGNREKDLRFKVDDDAETEALEVTYKVDDDFILSYSNIHLKWEDISTFKKHTKLPLVVKGVQRVDDVLTAIEHGADGVVLSNHGGRQMDFSRAPLDILMELMPVLRAKKLDKKIDVFVDGGIRRGSDVIKALCLGAKGVGLGRPFLYANSAYGENGVRQAIRLLKKEIERDMKLLGATKISELTPDFIEVRGSGAGNDYTSGMIFEPLTLPKFKEDDEDMY